MKELLTILKLFKPKYYNLVTGTLITCGTSLLSKPLWLSFINWGIESSNENYKKINIPIIEEYDWILGLIIIIITLAWHTTNRFLDLKESSESKPAFLKSKELVFDNIEELSQEIYPILTDNEYLFKSVGPNSGASSSSELRTDLTLWYKFREESIIPNNSKIKELLIKNENLFSREFKTISKRMILHIEAFEEHVKNEEYDYSEFQFPFKFKELIETTCYKNGIKSKEFLKKKKWINKRLNQQDFFEWFFFGSSLLTPLKAKDFDIVIYSENEINKATKSTIDNIKFDFKLKFKTELHITLFNINERVQYNDFLQLNKYKLKGNG